MRKIICVLLMLVLILTMVSGCGTAEEESSISEVKITLPAATGAEAIVQGEAVLATQSYLLARAYFDKLADYDTDSFLAEEYKMLLDQAVAAFRLADALSSSLSKHAASLAEMEEAGDIQREESKYEVVTETSSIHPFTLTSYATEEDSDAVKFAQELTKTFDNAKNGEKLKAVAEKYGTDVKKAKVMLEQAQAVLEGDAYKKQADFENKCHEIAVETKAAASTIGFGVALGGFAAAGGLAAGGASISGIMEAGGLVMSGVNTVIDTGTAVTIHTTGGEGNEYTAAWEKTAEIFAPASAVFAIGGGIGNIKDFKDPAKAKDAVDNAAQAFLAGLGLARDYVQDGTVLGISSRVIDGYKEIVVSSAKTTEPEAAKEVLLQTGFSEESIQETETTLPPPADIYIETLGEVTDPANPIDIDAAIKVVEAAFQETTSTDSNSVKENSAAKEDSSKENESTDSAVEAKDKDKTEDQKEENPLSIDNICGTYAFEGANDTWTQVITKVDQKHIKLTDDEGAVITGSYNEKTGIFSYSEGEGEVTASVRITFKDTGNGIKANLVMSIGDESVSSSAIKQ